MHTTFRTGDTINIHTKGEMDYTSDIRNGNIQNSVEGAVPTFWNTPSLISISGRWISVLTAGTSLYFLLTLIICFKIFRHFFNR